MEKLERDTYIISAVESGISSEAVVNSINDVIKKSEEVGFVPKQFNTMIKTIIETKTDAPEKHDDSLSSSLVKGNLGKLDMALREGITNKEVAAKLSKEAILGNQESFTFFSNFVAHTKKKENTLSKQKTMDQAQYQKVYTNN